MTEVRDPYEVLGVTRAATRLQIRAAYLERARTAHPDLVGGRGLDVMRALNEAWAILKDAGRRSEYDAASGEVSIEAFTSKPIRPDIDRLLDPTADDEAANPRRGR